MEPKDFAAADCFERMSENPVDAVFMVNAQGRFLDINNAFTTILGYGQDDISGLRFADIGAELRQTAVRDSSLKEHILRFELYVLKLAEKNSVPYTLIAKSGEPVPVILKSVIIRDDSGAIRRTIGIAAPENRAAGEGSTVQQDPRIQRAWETEQNYCNILENSGDAIIITDLNGSIVTVNDACVRMFGFERPEEMLGRYLLEFIPMAGSFTSSTGETFVVSDDYYALQVEQIDRLYETGLAKTQGYLFKKDRSVFPVEATMSLLGDQQGQQRGTITICRDVTDRIITERWIDQSQIFLENIIATIGDGLYVTDGTGAIMMVNRALCDIVGCGEQELVGTRAHELFPACGETSPAGPGNGLAVTAEYPRRYESVFRKKDGSLVNVELKITLFKSSSGEGTVGALRDITERKQFEEQLRQAHDKLERTVQDRTQDLQEANTALRVLLNARDGERLKLETNIRTRAHELIMPYIEKLRAGSLNERQRAFLGIIDVNLRHITAPFESSKEVPNLLFTPMETQVANLVQYGRTTKDIAEALSVSTKTVAFHRNAIRHKLGIQNKKIGLRKYLLSRSS